MGMLPSHLKLIIEVHKHYNFKGPLCSLGCQDIWASYEELKRCFKECGVVYKKPLAIRPHCSRTFQSNSQISLLAQDFVHARVYFEMLGINNYMDLDKFDSDNPGLLHDLNDPIPDEYENKFGMIFDGGTIEHVFDIRQVLDNIVRMLKINGCVVHLCSYRMDHGFFALSPTLLYDFYAANGFSDLRCFLMEVDFSDITRTFNRRHRYVEYHYGMDLDWLLKRKEEILIFFSARKIQVNKKLTIPTQGTYAQRGNRADASLKTQSLFDRTIPHWLQPLATPLRPVLRAGYRAYRAHSMRRSTPIRYI
jgi:hypothetical protein